METKRDFEDRQWMNNNGRNAGILWTYCLPFILAMVPFSVLGVYFLVSGAGFEIKVLYVISCFAVVAAVLLAIAREPMALALSEDGLWLRVGIRKPGHEHVIRWEDVERFTYTHTFGSPSLIAHFISGKKRALGFIDMQMIRQIINEQKRYAAFMKA